MNRRDKLLLVMISGFMSGIGFTMIAFHFNHKNILNENVGFWSMVFVVGLGFCLKTIFKEAKFQQ